MQFGVSHLLISFFFFVTILIWNYPLSNLILVKLMCYWPKLQLGEIVFKWQLPCKCFPHVQVEGDLKILIHSFDGSTATPWIISSILCDIKLLSCSFIHVFWEMNFVADDSSISFAFQFDQQDNSFLKGFNFLVVFVVVFHYRKKKQNLSHNINTGTLHTMSSILFTIITMKRHKTVAKNMISSIIGTYHFINYIYWFM